MGYIEKRDILEYQFLSGLCVSPGGGNAVFKVSQACEAENNYKVRLCRVSAAAGGAPPSGEVFLEGTEGAGDFCFLDEEHLIFSALKGEDRERAAGGEFLTVFYTMDLNTGLVEERFRVPLKNASIRPAGSGRFLLTAVGIKNRPDVEHMAEAEKQKALAKLRDERDFIVCDELPFMSDGQGYINGRRRRLYLYGEADQSLSAVTEPLFETSQYAVDPEGRYIAYSGVCYDRFYVRSHGICLYEIATGANRTLLAPGSFQIMGLEFLDGRLAVAAAPWNGEGAFPNHSLYTLSLEGGNLEPGYFHRNEDFGCKTCGDCKSGKMRTVQSQDGALYYIATRGTGAFINCWKPGGPPSRLSEEEFLPDSLAVCGEAVGAIGSRGGLQEIYRRDGAGVWERLTGINDAALKDKAISHPRKYTITDRDGFEINGFVMEPADYDPDKFYPGILEIHGGPRAAFTHGFFHEMQYLAGKGYFVFFCNPRGSAGGGEDFADIKGRRGTVDYDDLMEWTDFVLSEYKAIDRKRLGVMGGSYGGYMTNWIISHTKRFAAAVSMRSIADLTGSYGATDYGAWGTPGVYGGTPWANDERLRGQSPITFAVNVETPTLFLHSFEDHRCNVAGAMQMYTALQLKGVPTRMCLFQNECHELSRSGRPRSRLRRLEEIAAWMDKYLKV